MADNYLEKRMEEHRRSASVKPAVIRRTPIGDRIGTVSFKIDPLRVLVTDGESDHASAIICRLREAGCKVAFVSADDKGGRALAQKSGARFYPCSFSGSVADDLEKTWGGVDAVVLTDGNMPADVDAEKLCRVVAVGENPTLPPVERHVGLTVNGIDVGSRTAADVAHLCLVLCLKASECVDSLIV